MKKRGVANLFATTILNTRNLSTALSKCENNLKLCGFLDKVSDETYPR
jgi:hypothetical protein